MENISKASINLIFNSTFNDNYISNLTCHSAWQFSSLSFKEKHQGKIFPFFIKNDEK
jgi:hypothetical protein